jgi:4-amino-4-deoxy-L-arabinose transferase-like glycosyltransferase
MADSATVRRGQIAFVLVLFALTFSLLQWFGYRQKSATWDEPIHLAAGYAALAEGDYRLESTHPPFIRMWAALPLLFMDDVRLDTAAIDRTAPAEWHSGSTALAYGTKFLYVDNDGDRLLDAARFMIVLCGVGLGALVFFWVYEWLGFLPAACALAFYTLSPTVLANTSVVTTDAGITCFMFGTIYFLWRTTRRYSVANVTGLIAFFMLAIVTKFSAVIVGPLIVVLLVAAACGRTCITPSRIAALVLALAMAAVLAIWAIYGFRYAPTQSADWVLSLESAPLAQTVPVLAHLTGWIDRHRLLPNSFTEGFLMFAQSTTTTSSYAFLAGNYSTSGWWYYFPVAFLIKTPVGFLALIAVGVTACLRRWRELGGLNEFFLFAPVAIYLAVAMNSPFQVGIRHILPIYPFLLLITAAGVQWLIQTRVGRLVVVAPVALWIAMLVTVAAHVKARKSGPTSVRSAA